MQEQVECCGGPFDGFWYAAAAAVRRRLIILYEQFQGLSVDGIAVFARLIERNSNVLLKETATALSLLLPPPAVILSMISGMCDKLKLSEQ